VQSIVDLARGTAPEIFADTIVKLVESGKIPQRELQIELLEDAFQAAGSATEPVRLSAIRGTPPDTREIYRSKAGELGLDAISLQARILKNLLTVDRAKARELFGQIAHPSLDPRPCEDALVADIAPYYDIAAAIAQSAFTPAEKEVGAHAQFLAAGLTGAKSPGELAAFASTIENVTFTPAQWETVVAALSQKLLTVGPDYRSFAVSIYALQGAVFRLNEFGRANHLGAVEGLSASLRKYENAQMTAPRCSPDIETGEGLTDEESKRVERRGTIQPQMYFDSGDAKAMGDRLKSIASAPPPDGLSEFLAAFGLWTPSGSEVDVLHQKATVLKALLQMKLSTTDHERVSMLWVDLLASSGAQRESPPEWMWQVKSMTGAAGFNPAQMAEAFRASGNPGLLVYLAGGT
jgi:hypothetical protein